MRSNEHPIRASSERGTSGSPPADASPISATTSCVVTSTSARSTCSTTGTSRSSKTGSSRSSTRRGDTVGWSSCSALQAAAADADIVFLCVPTPQGEDGSADLSYIEQAAREIAPVLKPGAVVVNKSTVPVGSTIAVEKVLQRDDVSVVSNPEFLREGTAVDDFLHARSGRRRCGESSGRRAGRRAVRETSTRRSSSPTRRRPRRSSTPPTDSSR